ncbi:MAG: ABC transporter substrate-binding protein [Clostridiales bacterium]|nr:ABC transporter substrate-binding protein [Clostridiales bacterium]
MRFKRALSIFAVISLGALIFVGCGSREDTDISAEAEGGPVEISIILRVDPNTGEKNDEKVIEDFNRDYEGIYHMDCEWIMETEEEERQNMKQQNVTDELPAVLEALRVLPSFYTRMVEDGRLTDISSDIYGDEEWLDMIEPAVLDAVTEDDGSIYLGPVSTAAFACSGIFWNEELFAEAGIDSFPETWDEFWDCCDALEAAGITPLALHTEGTAWAPMLMATAELASTEEGYEFMKQLYPESYSNESGMEIAGTLQKLFTYTTDDALYNDFDVSYSHFFDGETAMIANGYWMIEQIPDDMADKVRFSSFPGGTLIASPETFGWAIISTYPDDVKEGALEFLKYRTRENMEERDELFAEGAESDSKALADYISAYNSATQIVPNYQVKWNSILQEETLGEYLPQLVTGEITVEEFTAAGDESIVRFNNEK